VVSFALAMTWGLAASSFGREKPIVIYAADFENPVGPEWSVRTTEVTPKGKRRFLGQFCNHKVTLRLQRLPRHRYLRISFELFVILSWDGNYPPDGPERYGPDIWSLRTKGGPRLLHCTFADWPEALSDKQSFPDDYPGAGHPRRCGASETRTLGYVRRNPDSFDAVYRLAFVLAHVDREVTFEFEGSGLQFPDDESWGFDNVKVEVLAGENALAPEAMALLWAQLADRDPVKACGAITPLVLAGDSAARFLGDRLPALIVDERKVGKLIAELDADDWKVRHSASVALEGLGPVVSPRLEAALRQTTSLEVKTRLEAILASIEKRTDDPALDAPRLRRAFRVLAAGRGLASLRAMKRLRSAARGRRLQQRAEAAIVRMGGDLIRPLMAEARAKAEAGQLAGADEICKAAHDIAIEAGHRAGPTLLEVRRSVQAGRTAGAARVMWRRLDEALASESARVAGLCRKALAAPLTGRKPKPPSPPGNTILHPMDLVLQRGPL